MLQFDPKTKVVNRHGPEPETQYIGRGSIWGNPFTSIQGRLTKAEFVVATREESVSMYKGYILRRPDLLLVCSSLTVILWDASANPSPVTVTY